MIKTNYFSFRTGGLSKGCQLCVRGLKSVLFVTGVCSRHCYYCPVSDMKHQKDVVYINEWPTKRKKDILKEIQLCSSQGVGITGGDPLARLSRTIRLIKELKKNFGRKFHIHLYTPLYLVTDQSLKKLYNAGLDEIRFHPDIQNPKEWQKIDLAAPFDWAKGVEIPVIPGKARETKRLIDYIRHKVDFLNLNELEISDTNASSLVERGYRTKDRISYGVMGSEPLAKKLLAHCEQNKIRTHYCTTRLKDGVQLRNRIKRRARNAKKAFDFVTDEGMLVRGAIYSKGALPMQRLRRMFEIPMALLDLDSKRKRILTSVE